jgi:hypothetical protein
MPFSLAFAGASLSCVEGSERVGSRSGETSLRSIAQARTTGTLGSIPQNDLDDYVRIRYTSLVANRARRP